MTRSGPQPYNKLMSEFKESYFRQRIGDLVSSYENRVAVLLEELESYKAENADLKTQLEATQSVVQEEPEGQHYDYQPAD